MFEKGDRLIVDIHGLTEAEAKKYLLSIINTKAKNVSELIIIHGYKSGAVLKNMVRNKLKHPSISRKILSLNDGETILILK